METLEAFGMPKPNRHAANRIGLSRIRDDIRSRVKSAFSSRSQKRPPIAPCPTPAGVRSAANSDEADAGYTSTLTSFDPIQAESSAYCVVKSDVFPASNDGPADAPHYDRRSEGSEQTVTAKERSTADVGVSRQRGSLKESSKKADDGQPRRVRSTITKAPPTFPRKSLYNLKPDQHASQASAEKRSSRPAEEPNLRLNHVPGSYRSDYEFTIQNSQSASPVSSKHSLPVTVEPLQGRSFEAVSSGEPPNDTNSSVASVNQPLQAHPKVNGRQDGDVSHSAVPLVRRMSSSYTLGEESTNKAQGTDHAPQPASLQGVIGRLDDRLLDSEVVQAVDATSAQALTPDLRGESAVAAVDFSTSSASASPPSTVKYVGTQDTNVNISPRGPAMKALSETAHHSEKTTDGYSAALPDSTGSASLPRSELRQLSPSPVHDEPESNRDSMPKQRTARLVTSSPQMATMAPSSFLPNDRESDSTQHWMRPFLGRKSAPAIGQAPPNLTARPHHRSRKVADDIDLQRSRTLPAQGSRSQDNSEQPQSPGPINRVITDLEGLLQQALHIAGQASADGKDSVSAAGFSQTNPSENNRQRVDTDPESGDESLHSSDESLSSDSAGLDEEQNRTTPSRRYTDRHGTHITVLEPDEAGRYHGHFKDHRQATPYPRASNFSRSPTMAFDRGKTLTASGQPAYDANAGPEQPHHPVQVTIKGDSADVQNVLLSPAGVTSSSVDTMDWAAKRRQTSASTQYPQATQSSLALQQSLPAQALPQDTQGSVLRERRPSKTPAPAEVSNVSPPSGPKSFSSDDDKEPIAYFPERPFSEVHNRGLSQRKRAVDGPPPGLSPIVRYDTLAPLPSEVGGLGSGSDPKSLDLKHRHHFSIHEPQKFHLSSRHRRSPIARDWSNSKKRWVALVACINTALMGFIVGIYAGEVPAIQYNIVDEHHYAILGNVVLFIGLAVTTSIFWPLPLLYGRKPFTVAALAILMPLQFPQAVAVNGYRTPYTPTYRVGLLLSRAVAGLVMGFANINFIATLLDLFGASLQSVNPHQEVVNANDVRRHGGGMGIWLGLWTWCFIGSIGLGFFIGAVVISGLDVDWGFWITIILTAFVFVLNVLAPEVRRSPYRRSVAEVRTPTELTRRVARGEVKMHLYATGPKWWMEEVIAGSVLCLRMLKQLGFVVLSVYIGWIYGQIVMVIVVRWALGSVGQYAANTSCSF